MAAAGKVKVIGGVYSLDTGRVDWHRPEMQLVYNVRRDPVTRQRRLMLLESYLRQCERRGDRASDVRDMAAFLDGHLLGPRSTRRG